MKSSVKLALIAVSGMFVFTGCDFLGSIFQTGVGVGIFIAVVVILLIFFIGRVFRRR